MPPRPIHSAATANRRAFTLVELFVLLCIFAVLAAVLFPFFARPRERSGPSCASHEKEIMLAILTYMQDYGERYPPAIGVFSTPDGRRHEQQWGVDVTLPDGTIVPGILSDYLRNKRAYRCPSVSQDAPLTYMYSDLASGFAMARLGHPARSIVLMEGEPMLRNVGHSRASAGNDDDPTALAGWSPNGTIHLLRPAAVTDTTVARHSGGCNYAYADGHVKWYKPESLFFPPHFGSGPDHRDPKSGTIRGPDPGGTMVFQGRHYIATFYLR